MGTYSGLIDVFSVIRNASVVKIIMGRRTSYCETPNKLYNHLAR
jgi:hypothetical protein